jgi:hypothetical protein
MHSSTQRVFVWFLPNERWNAGTRMHAPTRRCVRPWARGPPAPWFQVFHLGRRRRRRSAICPFGSSAPALPSAATLKTPDPPWQVATWRAGGRSTTSTRSQQAATSRRPPVSSAHFCRGVRDLRCFVNSNRNYPLLQCMHLSMLIRFFYYIILFTSLVFG